MNKEESLALLAKGKDAWNAWAAEMQKKRQALEEAGSWTASELGFEWNDATRAWHAKAKADFSAHQFEQAIDFSGFVFPGDAEFGGATFEGRAGFVKAMFEGRTGFVKARFEGDAWFNEATFSGLAGFDEAMFSGRASFARASFSSSAGFAKVTSEGEAQFGGATFEGDAWFSRATFEGRAGFAMATFSGIARFAKVTFEGEARFAKATFSGLAWFDEVTFEGEAQFDEATFSGRAEFGKATFEGEAGFVLVAFEGLTLFDGARFEKSADFSAIEGKSAFSLAGTTFLAVPDFTQAHFAEAPRFDDSDIVPRRFWPLTLAAVKNYFKGDRNLSARWRALKRLAVQGHDHMHELEFFKNELRTKRWVTDKPWHPVFWFGLLYGWLSDFGRSILRPLFWLSISWAAFVPLYLGVHFDFIDPAQRPPSVLGWAMERLVLQPLDITTAAAKDCKVGMGDPGLAALGLSTRKALLLFGLDASDKSKLNYACLFGVVTKETIEPGQVPQRFFLDVPDRVVFLGIAQHIISAILFFLLFLAIRNHFRIK